MSSLLTFVSLEFHGIDRIEPEFDPNIQQYTIYRTAGSDFQFIAKLSRRATKRTKENSWNYVAYPGHSLEYYSSGELYRQFWSNENWSGVTCGPGESSLYITCNGPKGTLVLFFATRIIHYSLLVSQQQAVHMSTSL